MINYNQHINVFYFVSNILVQQGHVKFDCEQVTIEQIFVQALFKVSKWSQWSQKKISIEYEILCMNLW